jgi:uncharacterized protein
MHPMAIDRRDFLTVLVGAAGTAALGTDAIAASAELYAATRKDAGGKYSAAIFDRLGVDRNSVVLPGRGHDVCVSPVCRRCVAFARRPGNFAVAFTPDRSMPPVLFTTPDNRHFFGHGVFSTDGGLLYTTENDFDGERGIIGVYDASGAYARIGEFESFGIGPHDLALMPDGVTLAVANGGIATHPDFDEGRTPLNLATMKPSLVYLDTRNGDLIERYELPEEMHQVSLRHMDIGAEGRIVIGCQTHHAERFDLPLIYSHRRGAELSRISIDKHLSFSLRGYVSSVAMDASGEIAAVTSSHGGRVLFLDVASGKLLGMRQIADVSGVASAYENGRFLLTSGDGSIFDGASEGEGGTQHLNSSVHWDNHAVRLGRYCHQ